MSRRSMFAAFLSLLTVIIAGLVALPIIQTLQCTRFARPGSCATCPQHMLNGSCMEQNRRAQWLACKKTRSQYSPFC